ncbi:MAG: 50S ribosomal protein L3 [Candidatus Glassbacteria bacterium]
MIGLIGRKLGMSQFFEEDGTVVPVTIIKAGPCVVTDIKSTDRDGYTAVQLGMEEMSMKRVTKPMRGKFEKHGLSPMRLLREFRIGEDHELEIGQTLTVEIFEAESRVDVIGVSKGRGFAGGMKRWGFHGFPASHGTKNTHRIPGSVGASADPARIWKNKKLPGHYGMRRYTAKNLVVKKVDKENDLLFVKGAVPGSRNGMVVVRKLE